MDVNAYALSVGPPAKSLGALLRAAQWMAGTEQTRPRTVICDDDTPAAGIAEADPLPLSSSAAGCAAPPSCPDADIPEPSYAGPIPPAPPLAVAAQIGERDITFGFGERQWRARGLARNTAPDEMKINLMVRCGDAFHVDGLDLLSAKSRGAFVAQAAMELGCSPEIIKRDIGQVLLALEAAQEDMLSAVATPQGVTISAADEAAALDWLKAPDLLAQIAADIAASGVVGEAENALTVYLACLSRKLDRPLAVLIQSTSAAGKSALMDAVLDMVPPEERVTYSAMTGQSLFYLGGADLKHKILAIAEEEGARHAAYALKLLQSQGALTIASTGKDPATGRLVTQDYRA